MKLAENFTLPEFVKSHTATRLGIDNTPDDLAIENLGYLAREVLQPVRDHFVTETRQGKFVLINSGYRCLELNTALGSAKHSQHVKGMAADFEIPLVDNYRVAKWISENLEFDQLILEFYNGDPSSGWVHVSYNPDGGNRNQCLTINAKGTAIGLIKS